MLSDSSSIKTRLCCSLIGVVFERTFQLVMEFIAWKKRNFSYFPHHYVLVCGSNCWQKRSEEWFVVRSALDRMRGAAVKWLWRKSEGAEEGFSVDRCLVTDRSRKVQYFVGLVVQYSFRLRSPSLYSLCNLALFSFYHKNEHLLPLWSSFGRKIWTFTAKPLPAYREELSWKCVNFCLE